MAGCGLVDADLPVLQAAPVGEIAPEPIDEQQALADKQGWSLRRYDLNRDQDAGSARPTWKGA